MQTVTQQRLEGFKEYLNLKPLQKRVVWLACRNLPSSDEEIIGCCKDAAGMNAVQCMKTIAAFDDE